MISIFETLPNEILLAIFSLLSWSEMLTSFWSLNHRINSLVCSIVSLNDGRQNTGLVITEPGFYHEKCYLTSLRLFNQSSFSSFCSSIRRIHIDGTSSLVCDISYEWLFYQNVRKKISIYPNLKSFILTQCWVTEPLIEILSFLIKHQLEELTLTFDNETLKFVRFGRPGFKKNCGKGN
ncbi:unnamed protein product [Rotaria sp. Silwood2]|nr:unnamed protein product [Rotaria sp. Silwood2]CAF3408520.1 unnamed protein product [Rotaria sp. Silwood2]CAF4443717.1 unnamed protein product [Rotaria sp. Silwood2]CAF4447852.1 unnamed protein product [Rotaria sp. Silwood2]CAF4581940.1 unnamed protein product [Rotaria sp. Silwood2]